MKLIVGLGNKGERYEKTRHNVGFMVLDGLVRREDWKESKKLKGVYEKEKGLIYMKPTTFMNESGRAVASFRNFFKVGLDDVFVVHDDLDIALGEYKIQKGVGPKIHNGVSSVEEQLGSKEFWRVRVGVDSRNGNRKVSGEDYVLGRLMKDEREILLDVLKNIVKEIKEEICI
jgi:peptidyl-tRNA hydrolase, PTH1 family